MMAAYNCFEKEIMEIGGINLFLKSLNNKPIKEIYCIRLNMNILKENNVK